MTKSFFYRFLAACLVVFLIITAFPARAQERELGDTSSVLLLPTITVGYYDGPAFRRGLQIGTLHDGFIVSFRRKAIDPSKDYPNTICEEKIETPCWFSYPVTGTETQYWGFSLGFYERSSQKCLDRVYGMIDIIFTTIYQERYDSLRVLSPNGNFLLKRSSSAISGGLTIGYMFIGNHQLYPMIEASLTGFPSGGTTDLYVGVLAGVAFSL